MKKALVLSGGSIKGAFQAGALADLLTSKSFIPDAIYGTSVGSLNGAFMADRVGSASRSSGEVDWVSIGNELQNFWLKNITSFEKIGKRIGYVKLAWAVFTKKFRSLVDLSPLYNLVKREINPQNLESSPVKFYACAVNIVNGEAVYASAATHSDMYEYIFASIAIPVVMPYRIINDECYIDGGLREVAPLKQAIDDGATQIVCIICHPRKISKQKLNWKNIIELIERDMEIVINETVNNDIAHCTQINEILKHKQIQPDLESLKDKRHIDLLEIRPAQSIQLELENFNSNQIKAALLSGWNTSQMMRKNCPWLP